MQCEAAQRGLILGFTPSLPQYSKRSPSQGLQRWRRHGPGFREPSAGGGISQTDRYTGFCCGCCRSPEGVPSAVWGQQDGFQWADEGCRDGPSASLLSCGLPWIVQAAQLLMPRNLLGFLGTRLPASSGMAGARPWVRGAFTWLGWCSCQGWGKEGLAYENISFLQHWIIIATITIVLSISSNCFDVHA